MRDRRGLWLGLCLLASDAGGENHVWLIGGGPDLEGSQAQIELNVIWVQNVLRSLPGQRRMHVYFDDGDAPAKDVTEWHRAPETAAALQPLARVFDSRWANGETYRNHRVPGVEGGTEAAPLLEQLARGFQALRPGDTVLLVFNGHGSRSARDPLGNTLELWGPSALDVHGLDSLLSKVPPRVAVRYVLTQCYSGAFARLARPGTERCGFMAEAAEREAEGCSASVETGDYRDYSTYFFAALGGKTRAGAALPLDPDRDGDGRVSLYEAHLYALRAARSSDLPRSTSEDYLERWLPRYLHWLPWWLEAVDNEYHRLARELAAAEAIEPGAGLRGQLQRRRDRLRREAERLAQEQEDVRKRADELRLAIEDDVLWRWPEAGNPYTAGFRGFLQRDLGAAQRYILGHPDYPALVDAQDRDGQLDDARLDNERALTQLDKIERLEWLGRVHALFQRIASARARDHYQRLLSCERQGL